MRLYVLTLFVPLAFARFCVDDQKGSCKAHDIWGFCSHNKTTGRFDCDESGYCVSQETLKNKKSSGCFQGNNHTVCCCNEADGCNLAFIQTPPKYAVGQSCANSLEEPNEDTRVYTNCDDPWCFAFLSADADGGLTTAQRGCHSRKLVIHDISKTEDDKYHNNTRWQSSHVLASQPTCHEILTAADGNNGTNSICLDFDFQEGGVDKKGRICCCKGRHKCNERFMWGDDALTKEQLEELLLKKKNVSPSLSVSSVLSVSLSLVVMKFL